MPRRHPISCCGLSPGSFCFLRSPYWKKNEKTLGRWEWHTHVCAWQRSKWCPIYILQVFHLACTHYGEITTMPERARPPFSSDLLNFGTKTIQINNSPNTFICDSGERNIPGLNWYINHSLINATSTATIRSCVYIFRNCAVSEQAFPFPPPPSLLCSRPNFFEDLGRNLLLRRLPAEVLNVMITAAAKNKKVKTVIWMRIVQKTEVVLIWWCQQGLEEEECSPAGWVIFFGLGEWRFIIQMASISAFTSWCAVS